MFTFKCQGYWEVFDSGIRVGTIHLRVDIGVGVHLRLYMWM
jgi:hypothetical protein